MAGYTITYDGVASTTIPEFLCHGVQRKLVAGVRDTFVEIGGMEGAWHLPEKRGLKDIVVSASILSSGFPVVRRGVLEEVADWVEKTAFKKLIVSDQPDRYDMALLSEAPDIEEWREKGSFELKFRAHPYSYKIAVDSQTDTINAAGLWVYNLDSLCRVYTYPIIQVQPLGGDLNGFTIYSQDESRLLIYAQPVAASSYVTVNSLSYTVNTGVNTDTDLQGVIDPATLSMLNVSGKFPIFSPGLDGLIVAPHVGSAATSMSIVTKWRRRYRS